VLDGMFHVRRMFGGNLATGWPAAVVARHYLDGYLDRLKSAVRVSEEFYRAIGGHPKIKVVPVPNGTNLRRVVFSGTDVAALSRRLRERGIRLPGGAPDGTVTFGVNETWTRTTGAELARSFVTALG